MNEADDGDVRGLGGIPLDILQKYLNLWYSASLDLFGGEDSSNAAAYFAQGLKGRYKESSSKRYDDHVALEGVYPIQVPTATGFTTNEVPMRRAMNLVLRDAYVEDCERALRKWNETLADAGLSERLYLSHERFNREMGIYSGLHFDVQGDPLTDEQAAAQRGSVLPTPEDLAYVKSCMVPVYEAGKMASWIGPPRRGLNGQPLDFEYVKFH
ncbi:MAG: benzoyl-CoA 2,3-dioxygenase component B [Myxococcota bacterium]|jgi:benzoyl-CoA 2,3-dioxygenase component B